MTEFSEQTQEVIEKYSELEEVSEESLLALGQAIGLEVLREYQEDFNQEIERAEEELEQILNEERSDSE